MFSGLADTQAEMLKEIDDSKINATSVVTQAQQKAESMKAQQTDAMSAIAKIPAAVGGWGIIWLGGIYWFILRPLLK